MGLLVYLWEGSSLLRARLDLWAASYRVRRAERALEGLPPGEERELRLEILALTRRLAAGCRRLVERERELRRRRPRPGDDPPPAG